MAFIFNGIRTDKKNNPLIILLQITENFAYKVSDYVASVLPKAFEHMKHHGLEKQRFKYIPNGINLQPLPKKILQLKMARLKLAMQGH